MPEQTKVTQDGRSDGASGPLSPPGILPGPASPSAPPLGSAPHSINVSIRRRKSWRAEARAAVVMGEEEEARRSCCTHCRLVFLASYSKGGLEFCSVDCRTMNTYQRAAHDRQQRAALAGQRTKRQHITERTRNEQAIPIEDSQPSPPSAGNKSKHDKSQSGLGMILNADKLAL